MHRNGWILAALLFALIGALVIAADKQADEKEREREAARDSVENAGSTPPTPRDGAGPADPTGDTVVVRMSSLRYDPVSLTVAPGTTVEWINDDPMGHTVTPTDKTLWGSEGSGDAPGAWLEQGASWSFTFTEAGTYTYYCIPHAGQADDGSWRGMTGTVIVGGIDGLDTEPGFELPTASIVPEPVAPAIQEPDPDGIVRYTLTTHEVTALLDDGSAYAYWTFDGTVPGPMLRVRQGDTVEITLVNPAESTHPHNIDLHAVTGPGGGAAVSTVDPGETKSFRFKALNPGVYVYHCAAGHVPTHIANGMYGMIVVEPPEGLAPVEREFYVVQGEIYTAEPAGTEGLLQYSLPKLLSEDPEYVLFNGRVGALTGDGALTANVGETVRIFFGVGGAVPSSFHVIGEIFDRVYLDGDPNASENRQTVMVPAAGSAILEFTVDYPGTYVLVDHTLSRTFDRGAAGHLIVSGEADPTIYDGEG